MMRKIAAVLLTAAIVVGVAACAAPTPQAPTALPTQTAETAAPTQTPAQNGTSTEGMETPAPAAGSNLTAEEKEDLLHMREEEKLARDVYLTLYDKWGQNVFKNIASAEQTHMDAIGTLLEKYGLQDPVAQTRDQVGVFVKPEIQKLYNDLVAQGSKSLESALTVGATIEDLDIKDLNDALARTNKADIKEVYENLKHGSENHMRAFVSNLSRQGSSYTPQYITPEEYNDIINGATGGNGSGMKRGGTGMATRGQGRGRGN
jgi:hypothetical protein